ncbi:type IV pilin [Haladaptatus pallidirubidus]|uniref:type IV pilin n=1 Tax=Haladaptatus pallidirubidus TaxID=1008152 RepID=UPI0022392774|nr:type IV pilin [Haladaptatus pallidirubidus]
MSTVIVVILIVAITVILAAVIGTFVMGLGDNLNTNVQAGASIQGDNTDNTITISFASAQESDTVLEVTTTNAGTSDGEATLSEVGDTITFKDGAADDTSSGSASIDTDAEGLDGNTITVTITAINDDTRTVVQTKEIEL